MLDQPYPFTLAEDEQQANRQQDYSQNIDIVPVADPNATTMAQRIMQMQAITQLMQQNPGIYNQKAVHRKMIMILGSDEVDLFVPPDSDVQPADPITENMSILNQKPVKAGAEQNHDAHIAVHMAAINDPSLQGMMQDNPNMQSIMASAMSHIQEHLAFQYRKQIEEKLGVALPPPGEPLPPEVEYELAQLTAEAANKLLNQHEADQQQMKNEETVKDPIFLQQQRELDLKEQALSDKKEVAQANLEDKAEDRRLKALLAVLKEMSETERSTLAVEVQRGLAADSNMLKTAELAAGMRQSEMSEIAKLLGIGLKSRGNA